MYNIVNLAFQSTLPARGATIPANGNRENLFHFNPRSPHGERRPLPRCAVPSMRISIHAPRTGSDGSLTIQTARPDAISIHAPRTGSDACRCRANCGAYKFQSTLPARGATRQHGVPKSSLSISIHAPRTGSDGTWAENVPMTLHFNPRSPHGERLADDKKVLQKHFDFNPRSPHGERLRG